MYTPNHRMHSSEYKALLRLCWNMWRGTTGFFPKMVCTHAKVYLQVLSGSCHVDRLTFTEVHVWWDTERLWEASRQGEITEKCMKTRVIRANALNFKRLRYKYDCAEMHIEQALPCHCECHPFWLRKVWLCGLLLNYKVNQRTNWAWSAWSSEPFLMD